VNINWSTIFIKNRKNDPFPRYFKNFKQFLFLENTWKFLYKLKHEHEFLIKNFNGEETENFIAETREGDINNTIVVGAHADGVEEGPGLNDNGNT
jgi:Zn-dependent M28 family amino/carboxypeptidase